MKLIKILKIIKNKNGSVLVKALFLCPQCLKLKKKTILQGDKQRTCSRSCSNMHREAKHGDTRGNNTTRLYRIFRCMNARCYNKNHHAFKRYGGKGVIICNEWTDYNVFKKWALKTGYRNPLTIDRIDNDGNYEPDNCQWITRSENTFKGRAKYTEGEIREIRKISSYLGKGSNKRIAKAYGASVTAIWRIVNNKAYIEGAYT